jgi:hypothetical protein
MNIVSRPMFHFLNQKKDGAEATKIKKNVTICTSLQHVLVMNKQQFTSLGGCRKYHIL